MFSYLKYSNYPECYNVVRRFKYISTSEAIYLRIGCTDEMVPKNRWKPFRIKSRGLDWSACGSGVFFRGQTKNKMLVSLFEQQMGDPTLWAMPNKLSAIFHCRKNRNGCDGHYSCFFHRSFCVTILVGQVRRLLMTLIKSFFARHISHFVVVIFFYYIRFVLSRSRWILGTQIAL